MTWTRQGPQAAAGGLREWQ